METPSVPVNYVPATAGEILQLGKIQMRVLEDGSRTDMRIGAGLFTVPANSPGPIAHWHEMHDETFLVTQGTIRFHLLNGDWVDAKAGDYVVVPPRAPHTFSNPHDEEAKFLNTFTPANYVQYFKLLSSILAGGNMNPEANRKAMAYFATIGVADDEMKKPEDRAAK